MTPLERSQIIDYDEKYATVNVAAGSDNEIVKISAKPGKEAFIIFVGNAVDAAGLDDVEFRVEVNRSAEYPWNGSLQQWAPPESNYDIPVAHWIPQSSEVRIMAKNSHSTDAFDCTGRIKIVYRDLPDTRNF